MLNGLTSIAVVGTAWKIDAPDKNEGVGRNLMEGEVSKHNLLIFSCLGSCQKILEFSMRGGQLHDYTYMSFIFVFYTGNL